ncbi:peptidase domain-containing ABC transporter [Amycolatopsis sp. K13G38]|uniref:Peptidase domain-containing ABC transporter n=1 Tax=Amycolatopsis acididurans TaxID=2724524 RepID=A0ABX1JE94_9PSEU|nr:peptidase domain-containing ABC transporter [Amycolatopsis acididurans]NKQ57769.1 peptidase domain-containing ABC transporter [Amycolatopsis acididurans]
MIQAMWRKRVPEVRQMSEVECGLACLTMVLNHYGCGVSLSELRTRSGVGRDGLSALDIVRTARRYGMRVRAISLRWNDFRFIRTPAILHWEFNHFVVMERWSRRYVTVVDPAVGRRRLTHDEFDAGFTGVVILPEPGSAFDRRPAPSRQRSRRYLFRYMKQAPGTFLQILGVSLVLLLLGLTLPVLTKVVVDRLLPYRIQEVMPLLGIGILVLFLATTVAALLREWLLVYLRARIDMHMMLDFVEHMLALPYRFFQQRSSGDLLSRAASNAMLREVLSNQLLSAVMDSGLVVFYLVILLWQSLPFGLLTLAFGAFQVLLLVATNRYIGGLAHRELAAFGKAQGYLAESLVGIGTLKAAGAEHGAFERWSNAFFDQLNNSLRYHTASGTLTAILTALRSFGQLALLWVGAAQVLNGSITLGTMVALLALASAFFAPLASLVNSGQQFQIVRANLDRISDVTEAEPEQDRQDVAPAPPLSGALRLEQLGFRYATNSPHVLRRVDLTIEAGQRVAIVGPSGSGKSTLAKLLLGLYVPTEGDVIYDGLSLQRMNWQELRRQFGVVLQESMLFSGSIYANIALGNLALERERVIEAAKIAAIHDDITAMPMGYDTFVAEGGSALSGGQRQRLSIARAVAREPAILLLDEATSHLDVETEKKVAQNLQSLTCTQIIIAHRLSTVRDADVILVLDGGAIVEQGTHHQLLRQGGRYAKLIRQQVEPAEQETMPNEAMSGRRRA